MVMVYPGFLTTPVDIPYNNATLEHGFLDRSLSLMVIGHLRAWGLLPVQHNDHDRYGEHLWTAMVMPLKSFIDLVPRSFPVSLGDLLGRVCPSSSPGGQPSTVGDMLGPPTWH